MANRRGTAVAPCDLVGFRLILNTHVNPYVDGTSHQLLVPPFRLTTVGRRTFPVAASSLLCNSLPSDIQSSPSLPVFRQRLKTLPFVSLSPIRAAFSWLEAWGLTKTMINNARQLSRSLVGIYH